LTNVHRHAGATEVAIEASVVNSQFHLKISDDGEGMPPNFLTRPSAAAYGVGIPGMRARLRQHGGWLSIRDNPAAQRCGTQIQAVVPLPFVNQIHPAYVGTSYSRMN
jgi:two-component system sensor histidine kinase DesK